MSMTFKGENIVYTENFPLLGFSHQVGGGQVELLQPHLWGRTADPRRLLLSPPLERDERDRDFGRRAVPQGQTHHVASLQSVRLPPVLVPFGVATGK